mgnify:CR=1 FL=1
MIIWMLRFSREPVSSYRFLKPNGMKRGMVFSSQCLSKEMKTCWLMPKTERHSMMKRVITSCCLDLTTHRQRQPQTLLLEAEEVSLIWTLWWDRAAMLQHPICKWLTIWWISLENLHLPRIRLRAMILWADSLTFLEEEEVNHNHLMLICLVEVHPQELTYLEEAMTCLDPRCHKPPLSHSTSLLRTISFSLDMISRGIQVNKEATSSPVISKTRPTLNF